MLADAGDTVREKSPGDPGPGTPTTLAQPLSVRTMSESRKIFERFTTVSLLEKSPRCAWCKAWCGA
jgi:hypothetical protein